MNCGDEAAYVEPSIDKALGFDITLHVPYINPYNGHVWLREDFDYPWFEG